MIIKEKLENKESNIVNVISELFHANIQLHIFHLQTISLSEHLALNSLYDKLPTFIDGLVETIQGKTLNIIKDYKNKSFQNYSNVNNILIYLNNLKSVVESYRLSLNKSWANIDNQLQVIVDEIETTSYKLKFLS